jgi:hypothetical protein
MTGNTEPQPSFAVQCKEAQACVQRLRLWRKEVAAVLFFLQKTGK